MQARKFSPMTAEDFNDHGRTKTECKKGPQGCIAAGTALAVHMSQDRPDLSGTACQFARRTQYNCERLKRFVQMCERLSAMRSLLSMAARGEYQREAHHGL